MRPRATDADRAKVQQKVLSALRSGSTVEAACSFARVSKVTWYAWLKKDAALRADYEEALASAEIALVVEIKKDKSWQSKAWLLERRFPDRWGKRETLSVKAEDEASDGDGRGFLLIPVRSK